MWCTAAKAELWQSHKRSWIEQVKLDMWSFCSAHTHRHIGKVKANNWGSCVSHRHTVLFHEFNLCYFLKMHLVACLTQREARTQSRTARERFKLEADFSLSLSLAFPKDKETRRKWRERKEEREKESGTGSVATSCRKSWTEQVNEGHRNHERRGSPPCIVCVCVCITMHNTIPQIVCVCPARHYW